MSNHNQLSLDTHSMSHRIEELEKKIGQLELEVQTLRNDDITILVTSGDYDKLLTAFILASGAISIGIKVNMFFSFWGIAALKKNISYENKNVYEKLMTYMMPKNPSQTPLSNMHMFGLGKAFLCKIMNDKGVCSLQDIINQSIKLGVQISVCQMTMDMMGVRKDELIDGIHYGGVVSCVDKMTQSHSTIVF